MKKNLHKFESIFWLVIKAVLYILLLFIFLWVMGMENISLTRLSRSLGITVSTFIVLEILFVFIYGKYDIGRRKSKPIIYSQVLAVICTDVITYLQLMIMRTNEPHITEFRLRGLELLLVTVILQILLIIIFTYACNEIFFLFHQPERCCIITSSQKCLDRIAYAVGRFKKQYKITLVLDYHEKDLEHKLKDIDSVFIYDVPSTYRVNIMRWCYHYKINVYFNPEIEDIMEVSAQQYMIEDIYLLNKNVKSLTMEQRIAKRLMDIILSAVLLVLSSPFWIGGMIAIKLYDHGPVLFKQERATINGTHFEVYKLRTMRPNDDNHSVTVDDDRITKPGKFLRRSRIDELPQLINVLKGDMSFVGPRPEMLKNVHDYEEDLPEFHYRLRVKAGLTGYAQIHGKYNTSPKDKLAMDMMYIENYSVFRDIQLIFQTLIVLLKTDSTEAFAGEETHCPYTFPSAEEEQETAKEHTKAETGQKETGPKETAGPAADSDPES